MDSRVGSGGSVPNKPLTMQGFFKVSKRLSGQSLEALVGPATPQKCVQAGIFAVRIWEDFAWDFPGDIFWSLFHKKNVKNWRQNVRNIRHSQD